MISLPDDHAPGAHTHELTFERVAHGNMGDRLG
jgi:hypothetical protein